LITGIHAIKESFKKHPPIPNPFPPREKGDNKESSFIENTSDYIIKLSRELRRNQTNYEKFMWELLRAKRLN
jgi:hypothetical protein